MHKIAIEIEHVKKTHDDQPSNFGNSIFKQTHICAWMEQVSLMKVIYLGV